MNCPKCQHELQNDEVKFCSNCGAKVELVAPAEEIKPKLEEEVQQATENQQDKAESEVAAESKSETKTETEAETATEAKTAAANLETKTNSEPKSETEPKPHATAHKHANTNAKDPSESFNPETNNAKKVFTKEKLEALQNYLVMNSYLAAFVVIALIILYFINQTLALVLLVMVLSVCGAFVYMNWDNLSPNELKYNKDLKQVFDNTKGNAQEFVKKTNDTVKTNKANVSNQAKTSAKSATSEKVAFNVQSQNGWVDQPKPKAKPKPGSSYFDGGLLGLIKINIVSFLIMIIPLMVIYYGAVFFYNAAAHSMYYYNAPSPTIGLGIIVLGLVLQALAVPGMLCYRKAWYTKHTVIDGYRLKFDGTAAGLAGNYIKWSFLTFITLGIYGWWLSIKLNQWVVKNTHIDY